jgi:cell division transport system permease protein
MKDGCMSTNEPYAEAEEHEATELASADARSSEPLPQFESPIVPKSTIAGRALVAVIAIMTFLGTLTTGAVMLVRAAANDWQADVAREVTIQVRPVSGRDIEADVARSAGIARAFPGVAEVRPYSKDESVRLLEPWLGSGLQIENLPVPRMVVVRIAPDTVPDFGDLRRRLVEQVPAASLDDHRSFVERMRAMARAAVFAGLAVLALVLAATMLSVMFATRGAIASNHALVEVLHLIGAKNNFIAGHFQKRFLGLGFQGGLIGGGAAIAVFAVLELANRRLLGSAAGDQLTALFGTFSIGIVGYLAVLAEIGLIAVVTAVASRHTVNRTLESLQ